MEPQSIAQKPTSGLHRALFSGWLAKALVVSFFSFAYIVSAAILSDQYYQKMFERLKKVPPQQALSSFMSPTPSSSPPLEISVTQEITTNPLITSTQTPTLPPNVTRTPTPKITQVTGNTPTPTQGSITNTPTNPPQATNTNPPTPTTGQVAGCFVIVSGYLYNMQTAIGTNAIDQNTGKSRVHTTTDYNCGTQANPRDLTAVYLDKHLAMGCSARLAPYIVNPPAPADPSCD